MKELIISRPWKIYNVLRHLIMFFLVKKKDKQLIKNKIIGYLILGLKECEMIKILVFFRQKVITLFRSKIIKRIQEYHEKGYIILVVTASPEFAVNYCLKDLPVNVIGTEFKKDGILYSNELVDNCCHGEEKVKKIEKWIKKTNKKSLVIEAWSDDFSDYPMLKIAKNRYWIGDDSLKKIVSEKDPDGNFVPI